MDKGIGKELIIWKVFRYMSIQICFELKGIRGGILSKCGHLFCLQCLEQLLHDQSKCGICRSEFVARDIITIRHLFNSAVLEQTHKNEYQEFNKNQ